MLIGAPEWTKAVESLVPGSALDLACGSGRHSLWLASRGWEVTAVDRSPLLPSHAQNIEVHTADLEQHQFPIQPAAWDLIVCWLYWQPDLLPSIAAGLRPGGVAALAGKTEGGFATSLENYRKAFPDWIELSSGSESVVAWLIARKPLS